jgi:hypothetical protein
MGEIGYFWKNADNQLPAEAGLVQQRLSRSESSVLRTSIAPLPSHPLAGIKKNTYSYENKTN